MNNYRMHQFVPLVAISVCLEGFVSSNCVAGDEPNPCDAAASLLGSSTMPYRLAIRSLVEMVGPFGSEDAKAADRILSLSHDLYAKRDSNGRTHRKQAPAFARSDFTNYYLPWIAQDAEMELLKVETRYSDASAEYHDRELGFGESRPIFVEMDDFANSLDTRLNQVRLKHEVEALCAKRKALKRQVWEYRQALQIPRNLSAETWIGSAYTLGKIKHYRNVIFKDINGSEELKSYFRIYGELREAKARAEKAGAGYVSIKTVTELLKISPVPR